MAREFTGLASFARFLKEQAETEPERLLATAGAAALTMQHSIKDVFGDKNKLMALSPDSTLQLRDGDDPLLITGEKLRDSIEERHELLGAGVALAGVGSSEPVLVYQEHGFVTSPNSMIPNKVVPPRPAFAIGVYESYAKIRAIIRVMMRPGSRFLTANRFGQNVGAAYLPLPSAEPESEE